MLMFYHFQLYTFHCKKNYNFFAQQIHFKDWIDVLTQTLLTQVFIYFYITEKSVQCWQIYELEFNSAQ